jgi:hypothetical protein
MLKNNLKKKIILKKDKIYEEKIKKINEEKIFNDKEEVLNHKKEENDQKDKFCKFEEIDKKEIKEKYILYQDLFGEETGIIELRLKDFIYKDKKLYMKNEYFEINKSLILFYSPLCKYCKLLSKILINLALSHINLFYFGSVNSDNIEEGNDYVCKYAEIKNFPTMKYITSDGSLKEYPHKYNIDNFIYFININI